MAVPFSNTKLRVPPGFQSLLTGLSTEVLRSQPRNIHHFAAEYFEKLVHRRAQGHENGVDRQMAADDRYYNNRSFQEEYPVNDGRVDDAATRIQAQFRGQKTRHDLQRSKENKHSTDEEDDHEEQEQEHKFDHATSKETSSETDQPHRLTETPSTRPTSSRPRQQDSRASVESPKLDEPVRHLQRSSSQSPKYTEFAHHEERPVSQAENDQEGESSRSSSAHSSEKMFGNDDGFEGNYEAGAPANFDQNDYTDQYNEEGNQNEDNLEDLEPNSSAHIQPELEGVEVDPADEIFNDLEDSPHNDQHQENSEMNETYLDQAATRSHASSRHQLDHRPPSISSQMLDNYNSPRNKNVLSPSPRGNKGSIHAEDDNTAAIKIQAAYRGYRTRRNLKNK